MFCTSLSFVYVAHCGDPEERSSYMTIWKSKCENMMITIYDEVMTRHVPRLTSKSKWVRDPDQTMTITWQYDDHFVIIWWSLYDKIMITMWQYDDHQMGSGWCALLLVVSAWHTGGGWKPAVGELEGHILIHTRLVDEDDDDNGYDVDYYVGELLKVRYT